jgi:oligopeptide/dipeptide ABC transporter ATP-binding protein
MSTPPVTGSPTTTGEGARDGAGRDGALLQVRNLTTTFPVRSQGVFRRVVGSVQAVSDVSLDVDEGETLGLVGESGCGKSTTGRSILQLVRPDSGSVRYDGRELVGLSAGQMRPLRRELAMVFQDPFGSLDPRLPVSELIAEPLRIHSVYSEEAAVRARVEELLGLVGLKAEHRNRYSHEFSGGQRQRIGIARALAANPRVIVLDEPVSALDVSVQAGVVNLLEDLQERLGLSYLFIAHDLSVVRHISDRVAVMYLGRVVEVGDAAAVYDNPRHPYTRALLSAVPLPDPAAERRRRRSRVVLSGEIPSPADPPSGCRFRTRCPKAQALCAEETPELRASDAAGKHTFACHFPEGDADPAA